MQQAGVSGVSAPGQRPPGPPIVVTAMRVAPNVLARQFDVAAPDQVWAGRHHYMWTGEGWLYVSVLLDLFSRKVVGWSMRSHIDTALMHRP